MLCDSRRSRSRAQLAREAQVRGERLSPLLEFFRDEPPVLADVHPRLEDQEPHDDGHDGPEHPRPEAREPSEREESVHGVTGSRWWRARGWPEESPGQVSAP